MEWRVEHPSRLLTELKKRCLGSYSSKDVRWSMEHNRCFVNHKVERFGSTALKAKDLVTFYPTKMVCFTREIGRILHEDESILVYDKPPFVSSEEIGKVLQTLLVHRLDRDTSGVFLMAKNKSTQIALEQKFRERSIEKEYAAYVEGFPGKKGVIQGKMAPLHRREGAVIWAFSPKGVWSYTEWECVQHYSKSSLLRCFPKTGRTHQIRVHLQSIKCPIRGDYIYGACATSDKLFRPLLHSSCLTFTHPVSLERLSFGAKTPSDFYPM